MTLSCPRVTRRSTVVTSREPVWIPDRVLTVQLLTDSRRFWLDLATAASRMEGILDLSGYEDDDKDTSELLLSKEDGDED